MRDFHNAKAMAKTLREALAERAFQISHSESLELIAEVLGAKNWQTLAAAIEAEGGRAQPSEPAPALLPVVPMRDVVVFPEMVLPLYAGRPGTLRAIERAMAGDRRLFLVAQRRDTEGSPAPEDLHEVGVIATVLQTIQLPDGTMKVMVQGERRAQRVRLEQGELLEAEVQAQPAPPADDAARTLAREALERFGRFANVDLAAPPVAMARFAYMAAHPGALADLIAPLVATRLDQAQALLETADPTARLETLIDLMGEARRAA